VQDEVSSEKKRIMFISEEDFYYFSYMIFVLLDCLGSKGEKFFKDHRKIAFIIPMLSDETVLGVFERAKGNGVQNIEDKNLLRDIYFAGVSQQGELTKLLMALEKRGYLKLRKNAEGEVLDVSLQASVFSKNKLDKKRFYKEYANCIKMKKIFKRVSVLRLNSLLSSMYDDTGVGRWAF